MFPQDELKAKTEVIQQLGAAVKRATAAEGELSDLSARFDQLQAHKIIADSKINELLAREAMTKQATEMGLEIVADHVHLGLCGRFAFVGEMLNGGPLYMCGDGGARLYVSRKFEKSWILDNPAHQVPRYVVIPMDSCDGCVPLGHAIACRCYDTATHLPSTPADVMLTMLRVDKVDARPAKPTRDPEKNCFIVSATSTDAIAVSIPSPSPELSPPIAIATVLDSSSVAAVSGATISASDVSAATGAVDDAKSDPVGPDRMTAPATVSPLSPLPLPPGGPRVSALPMKPRLGKLAPSVTVGTPVGAPAAGLVEDDSYSSAAAGHVVPSGGSMTALQHDPAVVVASVTAAPTTASTPMPINVDEPVRPEPVAPVHVLPAPPVQAASTAFSALASLGLDWQEDEEDEEDAAHPPSFLAPAAVDLKI
jgi:hypothetical protein